jgi:hypothetical protein
MALRQSSFSRNPDRPVAKRRLARNVGHVLSWNNRVDFVIVTFAPDIKLLRHCLASYDLYYQDKDRLFIFASRADQPLLERIDIPGNATILFREDYPDLKEIEAAGQPAYLKLISCEVVTTEYFCVIDSDFLFIAPTHDRDFFNEGRPVWFYRRWRDGEPPMLFRRAAEAFVGDSIDQKFTDGAQYVFKRSIAADLLSRYPLTKIHRHDILHEFLVYGWFAHQQHRDEYSFTQVNEDATRLIIGAVNQIPPDYLHLDPTCAYAQFKDRKVVVFWSYWDLAEAKMVEFFEDSQLDHFGRVAREADRDLLLCIVDPADIAKAGYRYFQGVFSDGWVKQVIRFALDIPDDCRSLVTELMVPRDPSNADWRLTGEIEIGGFATGRHFSLEPGLNNLTIDLPRNRRTRPITIGLHFGTGFRYADNEDQREFRARLLALRPVSPGSHD